MDNSDIRLNRTERLREAVRSTHSAKWLRTGMSAVSAGVLFFGLVNMAHADELIMKNGDRRQGTVVSMSKGELLLKPSDAGELTIRWEEVAGLSTDEPVKASLKNGETLIGKIRVGEDNTLTFEPREGSPPVALQMSQIKALEQPREPVGWDFDANISGGISKETGNSTIKKYDIISELTICKLSDLIKLYGEVHREWIDEKPSKDNSIGSGSCDLFLDKKWFLFGNATAKTDKLKGLDLWGNVAAGPGYQVWRSKEKNLSVKFGPAYECEKYANPMEFLNNGKERDSLAAYWAPEFDMWFFGGIFQIFHEDNVVYDFQNSENWAVRTHTGIRVPILRKFVGSFQFNCEYDNQPPERKTYEERSWKFGLACAF